YLNTSIGQRVIRDLRNRLYAHLQSMPLRFFTATRTGEIQSRLSNDVAGVQEFVTYTAAGVVADIATVLGTIMAMLVISPLLTLMGAVFSIAPAVVYLVAGLQMIENPGHARVTLGGIVAFTTLQMGLFAPLGYLLHVHVELQGALALFDRIFEYLDLPLEIRD